MKNIYRTLAAAVVLSTAFLTGMLIGHSCSLPDKTAADPKPGNTAERIVQTPEAIPMEYASAIPSSRPSNTENTESPQSGEPPEEAMIPFSHTEGSIEEVFIRLEEFKRLPEDDVLILLDVGHGGFDGGAIGSFIGTPEADINLAVSRFLSDELAKMGYYVFMTRMGDYGVTSSKATDMYKRAEIMHLDIFDASISIHMDSFPHDHSVHGARVYCMEGKAEAKSLAQCVLQQIITSFNPPHKQPYEQSYEESSMVVREPAAPGILVECGFLSNQEEEANLNDPAYQKRMAAAIARGIKAFLESSGQGVQ